MVDKNAYYLMFKGGVYYFTRVFELDFNSTYF